MRLTPTFTEKFFALNGASAENSLQQVAEEQITPLKWLPALDGLKPEQLEVNQDFQDCLQDYLRIIDDLVGFMRSHHHSLSHYLSSDSNESPYLQAFLVFKDHISNFREDFFSQHKSIIFGPIKEVFHKIHTLVHDDSIPGDRRVETIKALSEGLEMCAGGVMTALRHALTQLQCVNSGLKASCGRAMLALIDQVIINFIQKHHQYSPGNEVHFVNAYYNYIANQLGLAIRQDPFIGIGEREISDVQFTSCYELVLSYLKPELIIHHLAGEYLLKIKQALSVDGQKDVVFKDEALVEAYRKAQNIKTAILDREYGDLSMDTYFTQEDDGLRLADDIFRIVPRFVSQLKNDELLTGVLEIVSSKSPSDTVHFFGDFMWRSKGEEYEPFDETKLIELDPRDVVDALKGKGLSDVEVYSTYKKLFDKITQDEHLQKSENQQNSIKPWLSECIHLLVNAGRSTGVLDDDELAKTIISMVNFSVDNNHLDVAGPLVDLVSDKIWKNVCSENKCHPFCMLAAYHNKVDFFYKYSSDLIGGQVRHFNLLMLAVEGGAVDTIQYLLSAFRFLIPHGCDEKGRSPLFLAIENGHIHVVEFLLKKNQYLSGYQNSSGDTPLMFAIKQGNEKIIQCLLAESHSIDEKNNQGLTALGVAIHQKNTMAIQLLLGNNRVGLYYCDAEGRTALELAVLLGDMAVVECFLKAHRDGVCVLGDDQIRRAWSIAVQNKQFDVMEKLLDTGGLDVVSLNGASALMLAIRERNLSMISKLINFAKSFPDIRLSTRDELCLAIQQNDLEAVNILLTYPDLELHAGFSNNQTFSPLVLAIQSGRPELVKSLLNHPRFSLKQTCYSCESEPDLIVAAQSGHAEIFKLLLNFPGVWVNCRDFHDKTPLMVAAEQGHIVMVKSLLDHPDIRPGSEDRDGVSASEYARRSGHSAIVDMIDEGLLKRRAVTSQRDAYGPSKRWGLQFLPWKCFSNHHI